MNYKKCKSCGKIYYKKINCSKKEWEKSKFCSRKCINIGKIPWNKNTKGLMPSPWNKGLKIKCNTGRTHIKKGQHLSKKTEFKKGQKAHNLYKEVNIFSRQNARYREWRKKILERDNYTCKFCGVEAKNVHHIYKPNYNPELKLDSDNAIVLCSKCHGKLHRQEQLLKI